jgi:hypothetical protein
MRFQGLPRPTARCALVLENAEFVAAGVDYKYKHWSAAKLQPAKADQP